MAWLVLGTCALAPGQETPPRGMAPSESQPKGGGSALPPQPQVKYSSKPLEIKLDKIGPPVLSPDGRAVAFASLDAEGQSHIHVLTLDGSPRAITAGPSHDGSPRFSADGTQIAFVSDRSGSFDVWTVPVAGGAPRRITEDAAVDRDPEWSPDGTQIVFASDRSGSTLLYVFSSTARQVFPITAGTGPHRRPAWSPDGEWIAYESWEGRRPSIWVVPATGGEARRLGPAGESLRAPTWSTDGRLVRCFGTIHGKLMIAGYGVADGKQVEKTVLPLPWKAGMLPPSLARSGERFVYLGAGGSGVGYLDFRTGGLIKSLTEGGWINRDPTWSQDGSQIVFISDRDGAIDVHAVGLRSGRTVRLTSTEARESGLDASPVNGDMVFSQGGRDGSEIWILEPETGRSIKVSASPGRNIDPAWSPDGKWIAFASDREGSLDLWLVNVGQREERRLTRLAGSERYPTWSPDAKWVAFSAEEGSLGWIGKVPVEGGDPEKIASLQAPGARALDPDWNPKGDSIVFTGLDGGDSQLYVFRVGGQPYSILRPPGTRVTQPAWSHDGNLIGYVWEKSDTIVLMERSEE